MKVNLTIKLNYNKGECKDNVKNVLEWKWKKQ